MTAPTLPEFLLARYAEAVEPTWTLAPYTCPPGCCAPEGWVGHQCLICDVCPSFGGTVEAITEIAEEHAEQIHHWSRVLADVEAKRRIVARCSAVDYAMPSTHLAHGILAELALPFADHPDYREEWKP